MNDNCVTERVSAGYDCTCSICLKENEENEYIEAIREELKKLRKIFGDQRKYVRKQ